MTETPAPDPTSPVPAVPVPEEERPGVWLPATASHRGCWVIDACDLSPGDVYLTTFTNRERVADGLSSKIARGADQLVVAIVRWADGTRPTPPAPVVGEGERVVDVAEALSTVSATLCPYLYGLGSCQSGCHSEPACHTDRPVDGWPGEANIAALIELARPTPAPDDGERVDTADLRRQVEMHWLVFPSVLAPLVNQAADELDRLRALPAAPTTPDIADERVRGLIERAIQRHEDRYSESLNGRAWGGDQRLAGKVEGLKLALSLLAARSTPGDGQAAGS